MCATCDILGFCIQPGPAWISVHNWLLFYHMGRDFKQMCKPNKESFINLQQTRTITQEVSINYLKLLSVACRAFVGSTQYWHSKYQSQD